MKKIIAILMSVVMLIGATAIYSSAAGELIFSDNFDGGFARRNWITEKGNTEFMWDGDNGCVHGYRNARVLQSEFGEKYDKKWDQFYAKLDFQVRAFDDLEETTEPHTIRIWYRDLFTLEDNVDVGPLYYFGIEVETGRAFITKEHTYKYADANGITQESSFFNVIAEGKINGTIEVGEDAEWFEMGIRVTSGKIEGFYNKELVVTAEYDPNAEKVGNYSHTSVDETVGSMKSPFIIFNGSYSSAMWLALDNFEVWSPDYYDPEKGFVADIPYGDVNNDEKINMMDATKLLQHIAGWQVQDFVEANADTNGDGKVNLSDVTKLLQHIAGWDVVLGPAE